MTTAPDDPVVDVAQSRRPLRSGERQTHLVLSGDVACGRIKGPHRFFGRGLLSTVNCWRCRAEWNRRRREPR